MFLLWSKTFNFHFHGILGLFEAIESGKKESLQFYNDWIAHVKKTVPKDRLLVYEAKQGWGPLCTYLDLPVPNEPFPHVNDSEERIRMEKKIHFVAHAFVYGIPTSLFVLVSTFLYYVF